MLELAFQLSRTGRYEAAQRIFDVGLHRVEGKTHSTREPPFEEPLREILLDYDRSHPEENGGTAYQAFAYGYGTAK